MSEKGRRPSLTTNQIRKYYYILDWAAFLANPTSSFVPPSFRLVPMVDPGSSPPLPIILHSVRGDASNGCAAVYTLHNIKMIAAMPSILRRRYRGSIIITVDGSRSAITVELQTHHTQESAVSSLPCSLAARLAAYEKLPTGT